ncbi:MAG: hypothetical protein ACI395_00530 [Candidatus Cryptobacteroides sp.]
MDSSQIERLCWEKSDELLNEHFGELVHDAAVVMPETVDEKYYMNLPLKIEHEFFLFLERLWNEAAPQDPRPLSQLLDRRHERQVIVDSYEEALPRAYDDAHRITLWEQITRSNHEDVTFFKGLLKSYTEELLKCMIYDFREDVRKLELK